MNEKLRIQNHQLGIWYILENQQGVLCFTIRIWERYERKIKYEKTKIPWRHGKSIERKMEFIFSATTKKKKEKKRIETQTSCSHNNLML